ncbi:MAG: tol-pal system protein YbgF [Thiogranum sp.]|nr:tol-pal system protein YbgF [Thiogranum sp.]
MAATRVAIGMLCLMAVGANAPAASKAELEERIVQLERKLDSRGLVDLMTQMQTIQRDMQQLRGNIEVQTHELENLQKRQRDLYLDIDRRLHRLEAGGVAGADGDSAVMPSPDLQGSAQVPAPVMPADPAGSASAAAAPVASLNPAAERREYDAALEILKEGRYSEASGAFETFLKRYPQSSYADNAQYWLGEVFYVTREFQRALGEFEKVLKDYPDSTKKADARLKIGYIRYELKDWAAARDSLSRVVQEHPGTTTARLAQERLDRMQREGH